MDGADATVYADAMYEEDDADEMEKKVLLVDLMPGFL